MRIGRGGRGRRRTRRCPLIRGDTIRYIGSDDGIDAAAGGHTTFHAVGLYIDRRRSDSDILILHQEAGATGAGDDIEFYIIGAGVIISMLRLLLG